MEHLFRKHVVEGFAMPAALKRRLQDSGKPEAVALLNQYLKVENRNQVRVNRMRELQRPEKAMRKLGKVSIIGVDEVGVAPLAGPVLAAAVMMPAGCRLLDVDDSKRISEPKREELALQIKNIAIAWSIGIATPEEIDKINILQADLLAMRRAVDALALKVMPDFVFVDYHTIPKLPYQQTGITDGDQKVFSIAAASIIAKTTRDQLMRDYDAQYPGYGFSQNKGYGSQQHKKAILKLGVLPIHRRTFGSVREALARP